MASFRKASQELLENDWSDCLRYHLWVNNANRERLLHEEKVSKMFVLLYLGFKVPVAFYVSYRRKASSQQEWNAPMANFAWEGTSFCDGRRGLTPEQRLKTATGTIKALSQKTATCQHLCHTQSSTLTFPCSIKICIAISYWKAMWQDFLMEIWASRIQNEDALMACIYRTICFLRSQFVFLSPHLFLPAFVLAFRHLDSLNQSQQSSSCKPA